MKLNDVGIIGSEGKVGKRRSDILSKYYPKIKQYLFDIKDTECYSDSIDFLGQNNLDAVFICVPHTVTKDLVVKALDMGINVFAEKPPGVCLDDVDEMYQAVKRNPDVKLKFGFNHRYYKHIQLAKETIASGKMGKVQWLRSSYGKINMENWRGNEILAGHGILLSQGIHMVDLIGFLSGTEFNSVKSFVSHFNKKWYDDNIFAIFSSKDGITASLHSSCLMGRNIFQLDIGMEKGAISISGLITSTKSFGFPERISISYLNDMTFYGNPVQTVTNFGEDDSWYLEIKEFFGCIKEEKPIKYGTINDAHQVMFLIDEVYKND